MEACICMAEYKIFVGQTVQQSIAIAPKLFHNLKTFTKELMLTTNIYLKQYPMSARKLHAYTCREEVDRI